MDRSSLIRRLRRAAPDAAFALLLGAALVMGSGAALAGLPRLVDALLPAKVESNGAAVARLALPSGTFADTDSVHYTPQVLYPVSQGVRPDWLDDAVADAKGVPTLRASLDAPASVMPMAPQGPVIAICIDDLGENLEATEKAIALPKNVALSFLPFADATPFLAKRAAAKGHVILAHIPMQALSDTNPGPKTLKIGMSASEITKRLVWGLAQVPGLAGINTHEGSRFTADAAALAPVMAALKTRHLFFFDSRTGPQTSVRATAARAGVLSAERDVFLDDNRDPAAIRRQLDILVRAARQNGVAIAIGHPHDATLRILAAWLERDHGARLVGLDEAIRLKTQQTTTG
jgi:polysaccharide deacetylase 2 family uncharacterized protein YibQ